MVWKKSLAVGVVLLFVLSGSALAGNGNHHDAFEWTKGYSLVVTSNVTDEQANATVDYITDNGGQVAIVVSPRMMMGWVPQWLEGSHGILKIHNRPVTPAQFRPQNVDEADSLAFYNDVAGGTYRNRKAPLDHPLIRTAPDLKIRPDQKESLVFDESLVPSPGNSDLMGGKVSYNVMFVESNGTIDPNVYTWTCADLTTTVSEISAGLSFWSSKATGYGVPLSFSITYNRPPVTGATPCSGNTKVLQGYEPILHSSSQDYLWINRVMTNFGYASVDSFNSARRVAAKTNWATTLFVAYNPSPAPTTFTDGYFAYAWLGGPYSQILFRNNGWAITDIDSTVSHETGHLFGAYDEYPSSGCNNCATSSPVAKNVINGNCQNCNSSSVACMMRSSERGALCGYTPGQIGWGVNITGVKTIVTGTASTEKTNWVPGQNVTYLLQISVPGIPGQCVDVSSRWYRHFQSDLSEVNTFVSPCLIKTGSTWNVWLQTAIPAGAQFGEATLNVQVEVGYPSGFKYGKGVRGSARGKFFVLPTTANAAAGSPAAPSAPLLQAAEVPE